MATNSTLQGPGFAVRVPRGYLVVPALRPPTFGAVVAGWFGAPVQPRHTGFGLLPPGASFTPIYPGMVSIEAIPPEAVSPCLNQLYGLDNPFHALFNAMSFRVQGLTNVGAPRQLALPAGTAHLREFDAVGAPPTNQPLRFMVLVIQGAQTAVQIIIAINLYRWTELIGPFLDIVAGMNLSGGPPAPSNVLAVVDPNRPGHIEMNVVGTDNRLVPVTDLPTVIYGNVIINDHSIRTGAIEGTGIVVGRHNLAKVA